MVLNVSIKFIVRGCFYLIIIGVCVTSWIKLSKEPTTFDENIVENHARLPSFTLCPTHSDDPPGSKSIESFEDIEKAIEHKRQFYSMAYAEYKPYEQTKRNEHLYNDTSYGIWYFAPKINLDPPFAITICLIWTPSKERKIKPDWSIAVSYHISLNSILL